MFLNNAWADFIKRFDKFNYNWQNNFEHFYTSSLKCNKIHIYFIINFPFAVNITITLVQMFFNQDLSFSYIFIEINYIFFKKVLNFLFILRNQYFSTCN